MISDSSTIYLSLLTHLYLDYNFMHEDESIHSFRLVNSFRKMTFKLFNEIFLFSRVSLGKASSLTHLNKHMFSHVARWVLLNGKIIMINDE